MKEPDALERVAHAAMADAALAGWTVSGSRVRFFRSYAPPDSSGPETGTKLHVSSSVSCAPDVLRACLPVLVARRIPFKHVADLKSLAFLSSGRGGASQVGKFLTAYPATEVEAVRTALLLHHVTAVFSGPHIPGEQPFQAGSLVYSRDGSFIRRWVQLPMGRIVPGRRTAVGWTEDERLTSGSNQDARSSSRVVGGRYVRTTCLFRSPKGRTDLAFVDDADGGALVVVKEAYAHTMEELSGSDARSRLTVEAECLAVLGQNNIAPRLLDHWDEASSSFLVYEPIPGRTLSAVLQELASSGQRLPKNLVRSWTKSLCAAVARAHAAGWVVADIKPSNIVVTTDGLRLIDFELAGPPTNEPTGGMGTRGYCSPQQANPLAGRSYQDDIFAIGATALAMVTGVEASVLPDPGAVVTIEAGRDPTNPVPGVIRRCIEREAGSRFGSVEEISHALDEEPAAASAGSRLDSPILLAIEIGARLVRNAIPESDRHTYWLSNHHTVKQQPSRDVYTGSAGIALYLCALAEATGQERFLDTATRCGNWLAETAPVVPRTEPMPGLYFGDCGAALLYLRLYRATGEPMWLDRARALASAIDAAEVRSPDLMTGLAGVGLLQLLLWRTSSDADALERAGDCATELAERRDPDRPLWRLPARFGALSGMRYPGYAHGSAGIGRFLAEYALLTGDKRSQRTCGEIADWIVETAQPALNDGTGVCWTAIERPATPFGATWCHGTAGIARFLFRAHDVTSAPAHLAIAVTAVRTTAATRWHGATQCHGLAGTLEVLTDARHATNDATHDTAARSLMTNLLAYRTDEGWPSDDGSRSPDLMVGEAGVGSALLRLAMPEAPSVMW